MLRPSIEPVMERALSSVSEVACQSSSSAVAIAHSNDLAVDLNKDSVSKGDARSEWKWCAYKTAVTEGRIDASVGIVPHQSEVGRPSKSKPGLSNGDNVSVCLERNGKSACQDVTREWCCHAPMNAKGVIERSVDIVAYQQETGNTIK